MSLATASVFRDPNYAHHKIFQVIFLKNSIIFIKENPILKYVGNRLIKQQFPIYKRIEGKPYMANYSHLRLKGSIWGERYSNVTWV